jgi:hypothetical protein
VDREHLREPGDLEHLQDAALRADEDELAVVAAHPLEAADEHAEAGRVEEVHALEVDDDLVLALTDELDEALSEAGCGVHVDLTLDRQHRPAVALGHLESEIHVACVLLVGPVREPPLATRGCSA